MTDAVAKGSSQAEQRRWRPSWKSLMATQRLNLRAQESRYPGQSTATTGIVMAVVGCACIAGGSAVASLGVYTIRKSDVVLIGALLALLGCLLIIPAIVTICRSAHQQRRKQEVTPQNIPPETTPTTTSNTLRTANTAAMTTATVLTAFNAQSPNVPTASSTAAHAEADASSSPSKTGSTPSKEASSTPSSSASPPRTAVSPVSSSAIAVTSSSATHHGERYKALPAPSDDVMQSPSRMELYGPDKQVRRPSIIRAESGASPPPSPVIARSSSANSTDVVHVTHC